MRGRSRPKPAPTEIALPLASGYEARMESTYRQVLITGASSGIGRALALWFAGKGATVHAAARRDEALRALQEEARGLPGGIEPFPLDVARGEETVAAIRALDAKVHGLDLVIANAGVGGETPARRMEWRTLETMLQVNVLGATATLTALLPAMIERKRGHLVGMSSLAAFVSWPRLTTYSASKAYLTHFLAGLRLELQGKGVQVTTVHPGFVKSEMTQHNRFKMPFLLETDDAARRIAEGIVRGTEVLSFPWQMAAASKAMRWVPPSALGLLVGRRKRA